MLGNKKTSLPAIDNKVVKLGGTGLEPVTSWCFEGASIHNGLAVEFGTKRRTRSWLEEAEDLVREVHAPLPRRNARSARGNQRFGKES